VNGVEGGGTGCVPHHEPSSAIIRGEDGTPAANRAGWAELRVLPGRESTIRVRLAPVTGAGVDDDAPTTVAVDGLVVSTGAARGLWTVEV
jgi:hypothetical protein